MVKIEMTKKLKPLLTLFLEWKRKYNPNLEFKEPYQGGLKKREMIPAPDQEGDTLLLNDEDVRVLKMLFALLAEQKEPGAEFFSHFLGYHECRVCGRQRPDENFAKDPSTESGLKHVCKECFNNHLRWKRSQGSAKTDCLKGKLGVKRRRPKIHDESRTKAQNAGTKENTTALA